MEKLAEMVNASGHLKYVLTKNEAGYGIDIICTLFGVGQSFRAEGITFDRDMAYDMLQKLADFAALPANAGEIIDNMLAVNCSL